MLSLMKLSKGILGVLLGILCLCSVSFGATYYVAGTSQGLGDGSSRENAGDEAWFAGTTLSGDTVYLCSNGGNIGDLIIAKATGDTNVTYFRVFPGDEVTIESVTYGIASNVANRSGFDLDGDHRLTFVGDGTSVRFIGDHDIVLKNFELNDTNIDYGIILYVSTYDVYNVEISGVKATLGDAVQFIRVSHYGANSKKLHDLYVHDNYLVNGANFLFGYADANVFANGLRSYSVDVVRNRVDTVHRNFVNLLGGVDTNGGSVDGSTFRENHINVCGDSGIANLNCMQVNWADGVRVEYNVIKNVDTSVCDGAAVILDWGNSDATKYSENCVVNGNRIEGLIASCGGKGVSVYRGKNNVVSYNYVNGSTGDGFKLSWSDGSGNVFYNNTCVNVVDCFHLGDDSVASTWVNNIGSGMSGKGFRVDVGGTNPTESYNVVYGATGGNDVTLDGTDLTVDPKLGVGGKLMFDSPARDSGTSMGLTTDGIGRKVPFGSGVDRGAFEYGKKWWRF